MKIVVTTNDGEVVDTIEEAEILLAENTWNEVLKRNHLMVALSMGYSMEWRKENVKKNDRGSA